MKLKVSDDAESPVDAAFATLTDFRAIEQELREFGFEVRRLGDWSETKVGAAWSGRGEIHGKTRQVGAKISATEPGRMVEIEAQIGGMRVLHETRLVPLGAQATRINITLELRPESLSSRLLIQSLKLARARVLDRMQRRLAADIRRIEREAAT